MQINARLPMDASNGPIGIILWSDKWTSQYFTLWVRGSDKPTAHGR
jgi:hypothetical protein